MTDNEASVIDEGTFSVRRTIRIAAPIEKVWVAVTEPEHISRWFGRTVLDRAGVGAKGTITFPDYGSVPIRVEALEAPRSVSYRWGNDDASGVLPEELDDHATVFTFTLEPVADGTELTVVETGFDRTSDPAANMASHGEGWVSELDKLVALLEGDA
ncbi:SRPBCC domain-containing protein [Agromyces sp. SYSU K20354]|uniref:SRPBCC domain-containing protein n=1 Tax=Agromyces cavernae TaxID=2898659 RepID=UPI001E64312E|nr:SRPBCC domain-containing protein [Agromyces cavernae]MCD2443114.1 SRPBCC domain-containing protein [Agromyces cavernae]